MQRHEELRGTLRPESDRRRLGWWRHTFALLLLIAGLENRAHAVEPLPDGTDVVLVQVVNGMTQQPLEGLRVDARRRVGESFEWAARGYTDARGYAEFRLDGIGEGVPYVFFSTPYNGGQVRSRDVTSAGTFVFEVGMLPVQVLAGGTERPLPETRVDVREKRADGSLQWVTRGTTDANGLVIFDPPGLGHGRTYVLEANSPWDGTRKRSNEISETGGTTFVVGNAPLYVTLLDALTNEPLPELRLDAYERSEDGGLKWRGRQHTDAAGSCTFDLDGLGEGRVYVLRVRAFGDAYSYSEDLVAPGDLVFKVGTLTVHVVEGASGEPLAGTKVYAYERSDEGDLQYRSRATTDEHGVVRFDLPGLGKGSVYVLRTHSPWDGSRKFSNDVTKPGEITFPVGNAPLFVTLRNGLTDEVLAGVRIDARERLADGSTQWAGRRETDEDGLAVFDLDGLGDGRVYYLYTTPYNGGRVYSDDLTSAGALDFRVGELEVTVVLGADGSPLPGITVYAREKLEGGKLRYAKRGVADEHGIIRFDLAGLGRGRTYVLDAQSPLDGTRKYSDDIVEKGRHRFVVGNAPLHVELVNGLSGDPLPEQTIHAYRRLEDERLEYASRQSTDADGHAVFDLADLGEGAVYVLKTAPYNGGTVYSDDLREPGNYRFEVGTVEVKLISGADDSILTGWRVHARVLRDDGKLGYVKSGVSDDAGVIRFDLPGLKSGAVYVLETESPSDGSVQRSQEIAEIGRHVFRVGNRPLVVTLTNGLSGEPLADVRVYAYRRVEDERLEYASRRSTDGEGRAVFDLPGLGSGAVYVLKTVPYNAGSVYSGDIDEPGDFSFRVGTTHVSVIGGATGAPLIDFRVDAYEIVEEGHRKWRARGTSDAEGVIRFDLPGLSDGRRYVLAARSPVDGSTKYSDEIRAEGKITFVVGNQPLRVTLINAVSGATLAEMRIDAREVLADGETRWSSRQYTNASGIATFDLDGLGSGRTYILYAQPYNAGGVYSDPIATPGDVQFRVGTIPVTLIDDDAMAPIAGEKLIAYEKLPTGELRWQAQGYTDEAGTVHFDLEGLSRTIVRTGAPSLSAVSVALEPRTVEESPDGQPGPEPPSGQRLYVFRAYKPFDNHKSYYSRIISSEGPVEFRITRDGDFPLDLIPPAVSILTPTDGGTVNANGFTVAGSASDNVTLTDVVLTVSDPIAGDTTLPAAYDPATQQWSATVTAAMVSTGSAVTITATAFDQVQNQAETAVQVTAITDSTPPQITFTSHRDGDTVADSGFLLSGTAVDDIGVTNLVANVDDPVLGRTVDQRRLSVSRGEWTLVVLNGQITAGEEIAITLLATDDTGKSATATISLQVVAIDFATHHLVNRITFGATPQELARVQALGFDAFLAEQLDPQSIDDSAFASTIAGLTPASTSEMQRYVLLHALHSRRQLLEVMTQFWDNHFNTNVNVHDEVSYELAENDLFRQNALGRFRDLLEVSAKSPAMLIYLDNASSSFVNPNENYARELLELHAMGVDGGYTQTDVEEVARAFTGWTVAAGQFFFDASNHDGGEKTVLGNTLPAGRGIEDGEDVLDILAAHPSTASFICTKLTELFVSDQPPTALTDRCATEFLATGGDVTAILRVILLSPELTDSQYFRAKIKTPLEFVIGLLRNLGGTSDTSDLISPMRDMGMRLFENPVPTGWSEIGEDWINSNLKLQRVRFANRAVRGLSASTDFRLTDFFLQNGQVTADGIVGYLFQLLFHDDFTQLEFDVALNRLTDGGTLPFDINAADAETRLRRMVATVVSYPGYQLQ